MIGLCLKDCVDDRTIRFDREKKYDIDPTNPCAIYFELPKEGRIIAIKAERERRLKTLDNLKKLGVKKEKIPKADPFEFDEELKTLEPVTEVQ